MPLIPTYNTVRTPDGQLPVILSMAADGSIEKTHVDALNRRNRDGLSYTNRWVFGGPVYYYGSDGSKNVSALSPTDQTSGNWHYRDSFSGDEVLQVSVQNRGYDVLCTGSAVVWYRASKWGTYGYAVTRRQWTSYYEILPAGTSIAYALDHATTSLSGIVASERHLGPTATSYYTVGTTTYWRVSSQPKFSMNMGQRDDYLKIGATGVRFDGGCAAAYCNAVDALPDLSDMNNIANALDIVKLAKDLIQKPAVAIGDAVDLARDAWMGYRYAYGTTKSDILEVSSYLDRISSLSNIHQIRSHGIHVEGDVTYRCVVTCDTGDVKALHSGAEALGLALTPYNAWDMVPYSFVVDWFLDVGEFLERYQTRNVAMKLQPKHCWLSVERRFVNEFGFDEVYYWRFPGTHLNLSYVPRGSHGTKASTWIKRSLDVIAMV